MPFDLLQSILGATFLAVWCFIAVTMVSDKLFEARSKRLDGHSATPHFDKRRRSRRHRKLIAEH